MSAAGVRRLIYVSSISVLRPPRSLRERQNEQTPLASRAERLGAYTWGKCAAEELVAAAGRGLQGRIVRPGALAGRGPTSPPGPLGRPLVGARSLGRCAPALPS